VTCDLAVLRGTRRRVTRCRHRQELHPSHPLDPVVQFLQLLCAYLSEIRRSPILIALTNFNLCFHDRRMLPTQPRIHVEQPPSSHPNRCLRRVPVHQRRDAGALVLPAVHLAAAGREGDRGRRTMVKWVGRALSVDLYSYIPGLLLISWCRHGQFGVLLQGEEKVLAVHSAS
jgi:hypothetical protein